MSYTEIKSRLDDMQSAWRALRESNDERLSQIEKRGAADALTEEKTRRINATISERVDRIEAALNRPEADAGGDEQKFDASAERHRAAFNAYLRKGVDAGLEDIEKKSMSVGTDGDGGYLVSPQLSATILRTAGDTSPMRKLARVETISTSSLDLVDDHSAPGAGWTTETGSVSDSATPTLTEKTIDTHEMYAQPKATQKLLDDAAVNIEAWLAERIAERFGELEGQAFVAGDGSGKPKGFLAYAAGTSWGQIEQISSGTSAQVTADGLMNLFYALKEAYAANGAFVMHRAAIEQARLLKDSAGQYLWAPGLAAGRPDSLLGAPVYSVADMEAPAADSLSVAFGDFKAGYRIVDRTGTRILRDPFTDKPYVKFYATKRVGGDVVNFEAIKVMALSV